MEPLTIHRVRPSSTILKAGEYAHAEGDPLVPQALAYVGKVLGSAAHICGAMPSVAPHFPPTPTYYEEGQRLDILAPYDGM